MRFVGYTAVAALICAGANAYADDETCSAWDNYSAPAEGTVFTYQVRHQDEDIAVRIVREIVDIDGEDVEYAQHFASVDGSRPDSPPRNQILAAGMFPRSEGEMADGNPVRIRDYDQSVLSVLSGLDPEGMAVLESSETSSMNDRTRTVTAPFTVIFNRCDTIEIGDTAEPVRVYDIVYTARTYVAGRRPQADMAAEKQNRYYMSERYGWPLRIDSATGHIEVVDISHADPDAG